MSTRMDEITLVVTWDDTGSLGVIYLTKTELEEYATSHDGEHFRSIFINGVVIVGLPDVRRELMIETDDLLVFKLGLKFEICWIPPDDDLKRPRVQEVQEHLKYESMYCINIFLRYLSDLRGFRSCNARIGRTR